MIFLIYKGTNDIWNSDNIVMRGRQAIQVRGFIKNEKKILRF